MKKDILIMGALGNSLGLPYEFNNRPFNIETFNGHRDDDISQALMLAETMIQNGGRFVQETFIDKLLCWYKYGYDSLKNYPEGIGHQTRSILEQIETHPDFKPWLVDMSGEHLDGNGSLMRVGPAAMVANGNVGAYQSKATHNTQLCNLTCEFFVDLLHEASISTSRDTLIPYVVSCFKDMYDKDMPKELYELLDGGYKKPIIKPSGYVIDTLHAVLNTFINTNTPMKGFKYIINLGGDTDTTACIYGYLAGAYYGINNSMKKYISQIKDIDYITYLSRKLLQTCATHEPLPNL